jgi:hypothetical protein
LVRLTVPEGREAEGRGGLQWRMLLSRPWSDPLLLAAPVIYDLPGKSVRWLMAAAHVQWAASISSWPLLAYLASRDTITLTQFALIHVLLFGLPLDILYFGQIRSRWVGQRTAGRIEAGPAEQAALTSFNTVKWLACMEPIGRYPALMISAAGVLSGQLWVFLLSLALALGWLGIIAGVFSGVLSVAATRAAAGLCPSCAYPGGGDWWTCTECGLTVVRVHRPGAPKRPGATKAKQKGRRFRRSR